ncbi:hypothetical protein JIN84_05890 [Luteolibacter yonseiensis]|uniref:Uncharacterized protein n=1 Tax=Luteolibacter yonseiensis TaxID=1144680 RepID=A0A934QYN7_9BACT|nr:hypothetical protein [Luteolibacter yonseiensis]MBK1815133.1 hypothetical protein [Luteolibacter yonseiensis]
MITSLIPSFNAGELSPLIHLRSDLEKYRAGCRTLENMHIIPYGGVKRRPGFAFVDSILTECRLFRFQVSTEEVFLLRFGKRKIHFYAGGKLLAGVEEDTPYDLDELAELQMTQINHVAYFTHPARPVQRLVRNEDGEWKFGRVDFDYPAMMDENLKKRLKIAVFSGTNADKEWSGGIEGETVDIRSPDFDLFHTKRNPNNIKKPVDSYHVGAYFEISHPRKADEFDVTVMARQNGATRKDKNSKLADKVGGEIRSEVLYVQGGWTFTTSGTWSGTFRIQRCEIAAPDPEKGYKWVTIRKFEGDLNANYSAGGEEDELVKMRLVWTKNSGSGHAFHPKGTLEASGAYMRGLVKIVKVTDKKNAEAVVVRPVRKGATSYWREGAWSELRGFPRTVCAHEGRLIFGGNEYLRQAIWASAVDDYENFKPGGTEDDDSWTHVIASDQQNSIQWMISHKSLLIGTSGDEWVLGSSQDEGIITPTSVRARRHSGCGSQFQKARLIDDSVIFVQRGGRKLRDLTFSFSADGYVTTDLTLLADHITGGGDGIKDMALQTHPESRLWCVTDDGNLIVLTYDRGQSLTGWQRMTTGGETDGFENVAVLSTAGQEDEIWVCVRRKINGQVKRCIERMNTSGAFLVGPWNLMRTRADAWNDRYRSYAEGILAHAGPGAWVEGQDMYYCVKTHRESLPTSLSTTDHWTVVKPWTPEGIYNPGDHVYRNGAVYKRRDTSTTD